jgi:hypothetical protein
MHNKQRPMVKNDLQYQMRDIAESTSFLADHIYTPEMILTSWFNLSFISMTVAMVFYGIAMQKAIVHHLFIDAITICLISLSTYYAYIGYIQYNEKLKYAINTCQSNNTCSSVNMEQIKHNQEIGILTGTSTIAINMIIAILIMYKSYKKFASSR